MIPFTQFKFPDGHRVRADIQRPSEVEALANELISAGWSFEIEINPDTGIVHMDCCDEEEAISNRLCRNGPDVPIKVDELVHESHNKWIVKGKPQAVGYRNKIEQWNS